MDALNRFLADQKIMIIIGVALVLWWISLTLIDRLTGRKPRGPAEDPWSTMVQIRPFNHHWRVHIFAAWLAATGFGYGWGETKGLW